MAYRTKIEGRKLLSVRKLSGQRVQTATADKHPEEGTAKAVGFLAVTKASMAIGSMIHLKQILRRKLLHKSLRPRRMEVGWYHHEVRLWQKCFTRHGVFQGGKLLAPLEWRSGGLTKLLG